MTCPKCSSTDIKRNGLRNGKQQIICVDCGKHSLVEIEDLEIVTANVKLAKQKQQYQDSNRIERKAFREYARLENALSAYNEELIKAVTKFPFKSERHQSNSLSKGAGMLHLSDLHFNEIVELAFNKYDFEEAGKRLKLLVDEARVYLKAFNIKNVLIAMTGDLLNSDRRLDEYLNNATNRANATILAVHILKQVIEDLAEDFNITLAFVTGNESRVKEEPGWSNMVATDNYDSTIFNMLRYIFVRDKRVEFISGDPTELVVNVAGQNILLLHGHSQQIQKDVESSVQKVIGKYATRNIIIRYVLFGHMHSARLGEYYARSSSTVGSNDYSDKGLQMAGRASQNLYIVRENGNIDAVKIDLQETSSIKGYNIIEELEAYNAKSAKKLHTLETIIRIAV